MASDDGFGCYGLSKCINIGTCMHSKEIEHQANADQRHMSLPEPGRHITQILKSYDTLILKLGNFFFFFAFIDSMFFVIDQQSCL